MVNTVFHAAGTRGHADHGWLNTYHTFSFGGYRDDNRVHFGMLRVINDDTVKGGFGFGKHPHDNMEIITIVLEGVLEHKDTMGHTEAIHPNEVQVMSAGSGLQHSEYNHNKGEDVKLFQVWIFPNKHNIEPRYGQRVFAPEDRVNKLQTLVSPVDNSDDGLKMNQEAWIYRTNLQSGNSIRHQVHTAGHGLYVLVVEGTVTIDGQVMNRRDGIGIWATDAVTVTAGADSDVLLFEVPMQ